jgi:hydrogenase-4 component B
LGFSGLVLGDGSWWLLVPLPQRHVSYAPLVFLAVILAVVLLTIAAVRFFYHQRIRVGAPWDCGFGRLNSRMQDTAEGFGQPIRHLFNPFFAMIRELPSPFDAAPRYRVVIGDRIWRGLYLPLGALVRRVANAVAWLQQGRIATYLLYSFVTLVTLLALML